MNILIHTIKSPYTGDSVGGAETSLRLIAEEFVKKGHKVTYLSRSNHKFFAERIEIKNGVRIIHYPHIQPIRLFDQGIMPGIVLDFINSFLMDFALHKIVDLNNFDVIHTYYEDMFLLKVLKIRKEYKYKIIMRMAGLYWYDDIKANPSKKEKYEYIFNEVDCINYISEGIKLLTEKSTDEIDLDYKPKRNFTGDIGVRLNDNLPLWRSEYYDNKPLKIILATRFSNRSKRHDIIVEAVKSMNNPDNLRIKMIGEGENKHKIKKAINCYKLEGIIEVLPFQPQQRLWEIMSNSQLLCHPTDDEGLGKIIIESMAIGLPVLTSNVPPLNNYIEDGKNGFLADNDPIVWKKKIEGIIDNIDLLKKVSSQGIRFARHKYDSKKNIHMYEREFSNLLNEEKE